MEMVRHEAVRVDLDAACGRLPSPSSHSNLPVVVVGEEDVLVIGATIHTWCQRIGTIGAGRVGAYVDHDEAGVAPR